MYTGGVIEVPALHNQTYGSMWPMTIYKFENGKFTMVAGYHSREEANDRKNFPYDADKDGDGIVYYFEASDGYEENPIDYAEFKVLYDKTMRNHEAINAETKSLTLGNINSIF